MENIVCYLKNGMKPNIGDQLSLKDLEDGCQLKTFLSTYGGLESIALETLNLIKCSEARIRV